MQFPQQPVPGLRSASLSGIKPHHIALFHLFICQYMMKFRKIKKTIWLI